MFPSLSSGAAVTATSASQSIPYHQPSINLFAQSSLSSRPVTSFVESQVAERFEIVPNKGMTPTITYLLPTGKCPIDFYCRAEMSIYQEFSGRTAVSVGYSIWSFVNPGAAVPASLLSMIMETTVPEVRRYLVLLTKSAYPDYPYRDQLCRYDFGYAVSEFKKAISEMNACTKLYDGVCRKTEVVQRC